MGSTGYVAFRGKHKRFGGWGPALGDEGSGYWIGRAALRAIGEEHDLAESEPSVLWREIQGWLQSPDDPNVEEWSDASRRWRQKLEETQAKGFDPRTAVFAFAHDVSRESTWLWRIVVSSLTIPVMRAWKKGDKKADQIVQQAAQELWHQFEMARSIAGAPIGHGPVVLYGGVLTHNPEFRRLVSELVYSGNGNSTEIVLPSTEKAMRPVCGALLFAIGGSKTGNLCLPEHDIVDRLLADVAGTRYDAILRND
jgi:N-acetylglucosamine kinase-like BadF-type ATPase